MLPLFICYWILSNTKNVLVPTEYLGMCFFFDFPLKTKFKVVKIIQLRQIRYLSDMHFNTGGVLQWQFYQISADSQGKLRKNL